ncbi:hypothetical protein D3C87_1430160 [compost metagenome]
MISNAFSVEATDAGVIDALNMTERALCFKKSITSASPATNPPKEANDLLKVPMIKSTSSLSPKCEAVPAPLCPITPKLCASSTITAASNSLAIVVSSGKLTISPSILKIPSVQINFALSSGNLDNLARKSSILL